MPLVVAIIWGGVLVVSSGGTMRSLDETRLWSPWALLALFIVQGLARGRLLWDGIGAWGLVVWAFSSALLAVVAWRSSTRGLSVIAAGILANLVVVLLNGHMPVPAEVPVSTQTSTGFYVAASDATAALFLGDVLLLNWWGASYYLSAGDVLLGIGAVVYLLELAHQTTARRDALGPGAMALTDEPGPGPSASARPESPTGV